MKIKLPAQIETERLILKKHCLKTEYIQLWVDSINQNLAWLNQFLPHFDEPMTFEKERAFLESLLTENQEINYGIWNKRTQELMGSIGAFNLEQKGQKKNMELAIMLFEKFAGHGYGPEAINILKQNLFNVGLDSVTLKIDSQNNRSLHAASKIGFSWDNSKEHFIMAESTRVPKTPAM